MGGKYLLRTLGCKVNQYESQQIREILEAQGLRPIRDGERPDLAVVNGCAVTGTASAKTRQAVRRATARGSVPTIVVGCAAAADPERLQALPGVVGVWGHEDGLTERIRDFAARALTPRSTTGSPTRRRAERPRWTRLLPPSPGGMMNG